MAAKTPLFRRVCIASLLALSAGGCSAGTGNSPAAPSCASAASCPDERPSEPGTVVQLSLGANDQAALSQLESKLAPLSDATADSLMAARPVKLAAELGYDPKTALNLDLIQASPLALTGSELDKLGTQGFAITTRMQFPTMAYGLKTIYANDLPVYISIDPILEAVHAAYDAILKDTESFVLIPDLTELLEGARTRNASHTQDPQVKQDLDLYFSVALSLLGGKAVAPLAGADAALLQTFVQKAAAASGIEKVSLFGVPRNIDFSQFTPRGHYADDPNLTHYFQAMMWLGRTDFRLIETQEDGSRVFHRRQLNAMLALRDAVQDVTPQFERIDSVISAFVGEHDYMRLQEIAGLLQDLGASSAADVSALSDQTIAQTILDKGYGAQRIMSQVIFKDPSTAAVTLPLDRSFAFLGQRYVVDSHVFSDVTYDRVLPRNGYEARYLPDPLDAAYAALGNSAALPLLKADLDSHGHAPQLERVRTLIDEYEPAFWQENLYNLWLSSLRALSPSDQSEDLPSVARTERWSRRLLNTQLASWAQLRHDTILYAKQSYTSGNSCEFPDAYVDPYPEAFARLALFAQKGKSLVSLLSGVQRQSDMFVQPFVARLSSYFDELESVSKILREMAEQELMGVPFNAAQMAFVNDAVKSQVFGCGGPATYTGWYSRLMYTKDDGEMDPTIADVHTDPGGTRPAKVLHVATGLPRLMVLTVNSCNGPRAYAGLAFAYHELVTDGLKRLNDMEWASQATTAADVAWMEPVLH
jgi:hypothetical protein